MVPVCTYVTFVDVHRKTRATHILPSDKILARLRGFVEVVLAYVEGTSMLMVIVFACK